MRGGVFVQQRYQSEQLLYSWDELSCLLQDRYSSLRVEFTNQEIEISLESCTRKFF